MLENHGTSETKMDGGSPHEIIWDVNGRMIGIMNEIMTGIEWDLASGSLHRYG